MFEQDDAIKRRRQQIHNAVLFHNFATENAKKLGLSTDRDLKIRVGSFHTMQRITENGELKFNIVAELVQQRQVPLDPTDPDSPTFTFRGGTTLILGQRDEVLYAIIKPIGDRKNDHNNTRLKRQREYLTMRQSSLGFTPYMDEKLAIEQVPRNDFSMVHRGY